jgi:hypothetical protein
LGENRHIERQPSARPRFEVYESYLDEEYTNDRARRLMIKS